MMTPQLDMLFQLFAAKEAVSYSFNNQFDGTWLLEATNANDAIVFRMVTFDSEVGFILLRLQELPPVVKKEAANIEPITVAY